MVLDEATHYLYGGRYEQGIDYIDEHLASITEDTELIVELLLIKSRMYYHLGRVDQALYFSKQVLEKENLHQIGMILTIIYQYELGDHVTAETSLNQLENWQNREVKAEDISSQSWYYYALGLVSDSEGHTVDAKSWYEQSLELRNQLEDAFEANVIHYRLAIISRKMGDLDATKHHLEKCLELSMQLGLSSNIASSATLLGQDNLMNGNYVKAIPYLEQGVNTWKEHGSPFGIIWALGELAIVNYLSGDTEAAVKLYEEILPISEEVMPPIYLSNHYFNMFRFYLEADMFDEATDMIMRLEQLESQPIIEQRVQLAKSLFKLRSDRISDRLSQKVNLEKLEEVRDVDIKMRSLIAGLELLVSEYQITSELIFKEKILEETDEKLEKLMQYIRLQNGITYELHSALLRSKISVLKYDPTKAKEILSTLSDGQILPIDIQKRFSDIEEDIENLTWSQDRFTFEKEFHSIPALKIFLYLLPRNLATFSEIQNGTGLSPGQLSSKTTKLEEMGYIIKHKKFIDQKMTTLFSLTVKGFRDFKSYMEQLRELITL